MPKYTMPETFDPSGQSLAVTTVLDQSQDSHIDQLQQAAIGPVNAHYYRPILARFEAYDRGSPSWNWAASLCTLNWMVFRGMWMPALAYLGGLMLSMAALFAVIRLAAPMAPSVEWGLWAAWATLAFLVPGFFGNTWLFGHYRLRLTHALSATRTVSDACRLLGQQASSRRRLVLLVAANVVLAGSVLAIWLWPRTPGHASTRVDRGEVRVAVLPTATPTSQPGPPPTDNPAPQEPASAPDASPGAADNATTATVVGNATTTTTTAQSASGASSSTQGAVTEEPSPAALPSTASTTSIPPAAAPPAPEASAVAPVAPVSAAAATAKSAKTPARTPAAEDAGIRHAAIAARSRKAHQELSEPVAAATPPTAQNVSPAVAPPAPVVKAAEAAMPEGSYLINVGLFAQEDNARRTFDRLRAAGLPAITQELQRGDNTLTRVRVGPFASRGQADAAAEKIRAMQLDAVVTRP